MSDLSSLLMDPDLGSAGFTLIRRLYTRNKAATDETLTEIPANGCVFPGTPEMARLLPAEEQGREFIKLHTTQPLSLGSGSPSSLRYRAADLIRFRNRIWKVVRVKDWSAFNFYTAYAVLQTEADASPAPARLIVSFFAAPEGIAAAFAAVTALSALSSAFYGLCPGQPEDDSALFALARAVEAADRSLALFLPVSGSVSDVTAPDSLLSRLHAAGLSRTLAFYTGPSSDSVPDLGALLGTAMGLSLSHPESAFALCYKPLAGIAPSDLSASELAALKALFCNAYILRSYTHQLLEQGTMMNDSRYDERLYIDMISSDLQDAAVTLLTENPDKIPQTDDASAQFINRFSAILLTYAARGVLASGPWRGNAIGPVSPGDTVENGFTLWADSYDRQSDADRADHKAMPIHVGLLLAGSVESVVIMINVQI